MQKTIALFGGRFDPIHNGHLAVAREVLKVKAADEVWFSLEHQHQWRPIEASVEDRKAMLELGIAEFTSVIPGLEPGNPGDKILKHLACRQAGVQDDSLKGKFKIDETPIKLGGLTETISVIRELRKTVSEKIVFVVGSDQLSTFHRWTHWEALEEEVTFLVVARKGSPIANVPKNAKVINDPTYEPLEDSATAIREKVKKGESIAGLVPDGVERYIISHGLYK